MADKINEDFEISTHTPHTRRDKKNTFCVGYSQISTHTPHTRRDESFLQMMTTRGISTHTPHTRRDVTNYNSVSCHTEFLLTRLIRGVT